MLMERHERAPGWARRWAAQGRHTPVLTAAEATEASAPSPAHASPSQRVSTSSPHRVISREETLEKAHRC